MIASANSALIQRQLSRVMFLAFMFICNFAQPAFAKEPCKCWIDVRTGKRVGSFPVSEVRTDSPSGPYIPNISKGGKTAFNPVTKQNYALEPNGCWIDAE